MYLFVYLFIYLFIYLSIYIFTYLFIYLSGLELKERVEVTRTLKRASGEFYILIYSTMSLSDLKPLGVGNVSCVPMRGQNNDEKGYFFQAGRCEALSSYASLLEKDKFLTSLIRGLT